MGGGRETKESAIDLSVGIILEKKVGDHVKKGDVLATLHANDREKLKEARKRLLLAYQIGDREIKEGPVIVGIVK
ncbi:pyrimidine-nucleoside phosphorylase [Lachnospiraceae bacterium]|nr:pyrimidine-nucleoside phosphorylase [Lachnospiraceae bacterium]